MRILLSLYILNFAGMQLQAQDYPSKLKPLLDAEWAFINLAKETNTRDAFWAQFTDETIVIGEGPVNARKAYENQKPNASWLKWSPTFSDIAASGDFGYNTGPWEYRTNKSDEKAVAFGHFVSVWKRQPDNSWKLMIDIGVSHAQPATSVAWKTSSVLSEKNTSSNSMVSFEKLEHDFIDAQGKNKQEAYANHLSIEARIYRSTKEPITDAVMIKELLNAEQPVTYHFMGGAMAFSGDLAFAYGTAIVRLDANQTKSASYLRIWKKEKSNGWKIVLDLLTYR